MSELNAQDLLDWQKLHDWASTKPEGSEIGVTCTNSRCPVANYLQEQTQKLWSVGASIKAMAGTKDRLDKPAWVQELVERVDLTTSNQSKPMSREQFMQCLNDVKRMHDLEAQGEKGQQQ